MGIEDLLITNYISPENHTAGNNEDKLKEIHLNSEVDFKKIIAVDHDQGSNMQP